MIWTQHGYTESNSFASGGDELRSRHAVRAGACAILPDHVHLLIRKHKHRAEKMIATLQGAGRDAIRARRAIRGDGDHPVWGGHGWKVFLDRPEGVRRTIRYIQANPVKLGWSEQDWAFVSTYDNWPLHPGHNPNSPYAKRLRRYKH